MDTITTTKCRYCDRPAMQDFCLCDFHTDWECACNIVEDECCGSIPVGCVVFKMIEDFGWTEEQIQTIRQKETI